jgi:hypothetical protein
MAPEAIMPIDHEDEDVLDGPIPEPDAEPTPAERARARAFADIVDKTLAGRTPPAMSADDRALVEVATVIRAASGHVELPAAARRSVVEDALRQAIGATAPSASLGATPIASARARRRWLPWAVSATSTAVAAAAVLALWLAPRDVGSGRTGGSPGTVAKTVPVELRSRPSDALIGPIARDRDGDAADRIDAIFADRLDGYRAEIYGGAK